jgi:hypothetical protein
LRHQHKTTQQHQRRYNNRQPSSRLPHPTLHDHTSNQQEHASDQNKRRPASLRQTTYINSKHNNPRSVKTAIKSNRLSFAWQHPFSQNQVQCSADVREKAQLIGARNTLQPGDSGEENYLF